MLQPLLFILGLMVVALLYIEMPVISEALVRFRQRRRITCPEHGHEADVKIDAAHAAMTAAVGRRDIRVEECSRWPEKEGCDQHTSVHPITCVICNV